MEIAFLAEQVDELTHAFETKIEKFNCENTDDNQLGDKLCTVETDTNILKQDVQVM